jgi:hypothetical protein
MRQLWARIEDEAVAAFGSSFLYIITIQGQ